MQRNRVSRKHDSLQLWGKLLVLSAGTAWKPFDPMWSPCVKPPGWRVIEGSKLVGEALSESESQSASSPKPVRGLLGST